MMRIHHARLLAAAVAALLPWARAARAIDGTLTVHDPSTVAVCDGKYYVYGTGRGIPILASDDGFTWRRAGSVFDRIPDSVKALVPKNGGTDVWAPDIIKIKDQFYLYYSISFWGEFNSAVGLMTSPTLNPADPAYKWTDRGPVVHSTGADGENLNAIDPGVFHDPTDGSLWLAYGSYHGNIELVQLDPATGLRLDKSSRPTIIANTSESSDILYRDGWYYLVTNHGSCCQGATSTYNLRVGRAKKVTGPYLDEFGVDMAKGGGTLFLSAGGGKIGPGHFGRLVVDEKAGVEKFSCHYEADLSRPGGSVLDIRPLLWSADGWPVAGSNLTDGTYQILSRRLGTALEVPADFRPPAPGRGRGRGRGGPATAPAATTAAITPAGGSAAPPNAAAPAPRPAATQPATLRHTGYLIQDQQKWTVAAAGGGAFTITLAAGTRILEAAGDGEVLAVPRSPDTAPAGALPAAQLWQIDQHTDGAYRIRSKATGRVLAASDRRETAADGTPRPNVRLEDAAPGNDLQKWQLMAP